uniref:Uncharacterized protein n=1 Tax=Tanacetum cinerariifolium TaxID=118510 RepID=A0A6L2LYK5_TANCI|nr:hypothetical protein [Tanacetum cinerariifolium]
MYLFVGEACEYETILECEKVETKLLARHNRIAHKIANSAIKRQRQKVSIANAIRSWSVPYGSLPLCKRKICDAHYIVVARVLSSSDCLSGAGVSISDELVSCITQVANLFLDGNYPKILGEYIASVPLIPLVKSGGGIRPIVVGTVWRRLVSKLDCTIGNTPYGHAKGCNKAWYLDDCTIIGDTLVVGKVLELITKNGPCCGLHPSVDKLSVLVMKRVAKTIVLMNTISKINDPQCELLLFAACAGISKLYFAMRTCSPQVFEMTQRSFDAALRSALERDVLNYAFLASRLQSASLQTKLLLHSGIVASRCPSFFLFRNCGQLALNSLRVIFTETMLYLVPVLLVSSIDMLIYSWDEGLNVCVDLTGSSLLMQTWMVDFVPGRVVIDATQRKRFKYEAKCEVIGYGFLSFSLSSLGELDKDAVTLLRLIRKFSVTQDIRARVVVHIFNRINFAIAKGVGAQLVSRLLTNLL